MSLFSQLRKQKPIFVFFLNLFLNPEIGLDESAGLLLMDPTLGQTHCSVLAVHFLVHHILPGHLCCQPHLCLS